MKPRHFETGFCQVKAAGFEGIRFREGLIHETEDVGAVAFFLDFSAGAFGFDESGDAFREINDFVGFRQEFLGDRNAGHEITFSRTLSGCKVTRERWKIGGGSF
jgi:hypothetical protein